MLKKKSREDWEEIRMRFGEGKGKLPPATMPGLYPLIYLDGDDNIICNECATQSLDDPDAWEEEVPVAYDAYMEGPPVFCAECGKEIKSAYGDPFTND